MAFYPTLFSGFARVQSDAGDTRHLNFVLEHGHRWLFGGGQVALLSPPVFFPEPGTAAYSELLLGVLPFYSPWRAAGFAPDTAFQLWMLTVGALNFAAGTVFFRRGLRLDALPAACAAFLFSFGGARLSQLNHQHLLPHFYTLVALYGLVRLFDARAPRRPATYAALFFGGLVLQVYATYLYGWFLGFGLFVAAGWALAKPDTRRELASALVKHRLPLVLGVALSAVALVPLGAAYWTAAKSVGLRDFSEAEGMLPRVQSWLYQGPDNWLFGWLARFSTFSQLPVEGEHRIGLGPLTTVVVGLTFWKERSRPLVRLLALATGTLVLGTMMYRWHFSPWRWVFGAVPGAAAIRAVCRVGLMLAVPASVAVGLFLQRLGGSGRKGWALAVAAGCVLEQGQSLGSYSRDELRARARAVASQVGPGCAAFFHAEAGGGRSREEIQLDAMWAALDTGVPTVNGYSSNFPPGWDLLDARIDEPAGGRARLRSALDRWAASRSVSASSICWVETPAAAQAASP